MAKNKKKTTKKKIKKPKKKPTKKLKKIKQIKVIKEKLESEVEEKIQEAEEEVEDKKFAEFTISPESTTPVLEKIAQAPEIETSEWDIKTPESSREQEKEKPKSEYEFLEKTIEYEPQEAKAPVLTRRQEIDIQSIGRERATVGREFHMQTPEELTSKSREYEPETIVMQRGFEPTKKTKEKIGRDYTPKREMR